jgi:splicing factor 45
LTSPALPAAKMSLADWTGQDGDDFYYEDTRGPRQRGGRKKKKKKKDAEPEVQDWDDLYDPTRPNNYEEYMKSEERIREIREWKERLYAHKLAARRPSSDLSSEEDDRDRRPINGKDFHCAM